jgi:hypothetical protein
MILIDFTLAAVEKADVESVFDSYTCHEDERLQKEMGGTG